MPKFSISRSVPNREPLPYPAHAETILQRWQMRKRGLYPVYGKKDIFIKTGGY